MKLRGINLPLFLYLYNMASVEKYLDLFLDGDFDAEKYFSNLSNWFDLLNSRGLINHKDLLSAKNSDDWENEFILWLYDNDREKYYQVVKEELSDIVIEESKIFWQGDREDLALLFCDGRDFGQETVKRILVGEDFYESFWDTTDEVYRDVIEELNEENIERLKKYVLKNLKGIKLSTETEEMELIASEQGHEEYWEIDENNVARIIDDEDSMKSLLNDELSDLKSELYSIHSNSYNSAYESDLVESIYKELDDYFDTSSGKWVYVPHPYKKETTVERYKLPIHDFEGIVNDYLYENKKYGDSGTLRNKGSFISIVDESKDCLSPRIPDYPDFREVDKNINLYFSDYI